MIKKIGVILIMLSLFTSCSVYRPVEVSYKDFSNKHKEYYLRFDNHPGKIFKLENLESNDMYLRAYVNEYFSRQNEKVSIELWMNDDFEMNFANGDEIKIFPADIKRVEEYRYSTRATIQNITGAVFGAGVLAAIYIVSTNQG